MPDLTIAEFAAITKRHPETLRRMARTGSLPGAYKIGRDWLISQEAANRIRNLPEGTPLEAEAEATAAGRAGQ